MKIGDRIKQKRESVGMTQPELAALIQSTKQNIYKYESGIITNIPSDKIEAIAAALMVSPAYLMGWEEENPVESNNVTPIRFLGSVAAGYNHLANEEYEYMNIPTDRMSGRKTEDFFIMRVSGSSMYPKYCDGDNILCLACSDMGYSGRIGVIVYGDGEATLKKIVYEPGGDWLDLVPINPEYETKRISGVGLERCRIIGRAIKLIRDIDIV